MTVTKADIINSVCNRLGCTRAQSSDIVASVVDIIKQTLESGDDVLISGFGKFCVKGKKERRGRNPQTGEDMILQSRRVVTFNCSSVLRNRINI
jgi:integration host factor subunit alpha